MEKKSCTCNVFVFSLMLKMGPYLSQVGLNLDLRAYNLLIFVNMFQWTLSDFFLTSDFLAESLKVNKNQRKRSLILQCGFVQKSSLVLRTSTHLALKLICSATQPKTFLTLQFFQQTFFCLVSEKTFALPNFLRPKNCILEAL